MSIIDEKEGNVSKPILKVAAVQGTPEEEKITNSKELPLDLGKSSYKEGEYIEVQTGSYSNREEVRESTEDAEKNLKPKKSEQKGSEQGDSENKGEDR